MSFFLWHLYWVFLEPTWFSKFCFWLTTSFGKTASNLFLQPVSELQVLGSLCLLLCVMEWLGELEDPLSRHSWLLGYGGIWGSGACQRWPAPHSHSLSFSTLKLWDYSKGKVSFRHVAGLACMPAPGNRLRVVWLTHELQQERLSHLLLMSKYGTSPFNDMFYE